MTVETLIQSEFTDQQVADMHQGNKRILRLYKGGALDDWLEFCEPLAAIRQAALRSAFSNDPRSKLVQEYARDLLRELMPAFLERDGKMKDEVGHLIFLAEPTNREVLDAYRAGLSEKNLINLATPKGARLAVDRILRQRAAEAKAKQLGARDHGHDVEQALAEQAAKDGDDTQPAATDRQLIAAFRRRPVGQIALLYIAENQDRANDLAEAIKIEIKQARIDLKDKAARGRS